MNTAEITDQPLAPQAALQSAYNARGKAQQAVSEYKDVCDRAATMVEAARVESEKHATEENEWVARYQRRLHDWVIAGNHGQPPVVVPSDKSAMARRTSEIAYGAAQGMLTELQGVLARARVELGEAESTVVGAVEQIFAAEAAEAAAGIAAKLGELEALGVTMRALLPVLDDLNTPINKLGRPYTPLINAANELLTLLGNRRGIHTPISELRGAAAPSLSVARQRAAERRAALIEGSGDQT